MRCSQTELPTVNTDRSMIMPVQRMPDLKRQSRLNLTRRSIVSYFCLTFLAMGLCDETCKGVMITVSLIETLCRSIGVS